MGSPISPLVSKHQTLGQESQLLNFLTICTNTVLLIDVAAKICIGFERSFGYFSFSVILTRYIMPIGLPMIVKIWQHTSF